MKLFWKLFLSVCTCMMLAFSACGTFLIHSGFKSAREKDIQNGYNNASVVCINLVQNVKRTINLVYRDTGYEKQKNVVVRQAAQSVSVRNAGEEVQFALWTDEKTRIYSTNGLKGADVSICRDDLEAGQEGYKIVKRNGRYMLYTGTSFQVLDRVYYVESFSDITRDYENRDAQLRMFRMIMIIVMIVCLMLMAILNNMIVVPIRRLSKATKLVAGGRAGIRIRKRSKDEIGVLAEDFNRMSTSLNRTMKELEEKTKSQEMFTNNFAHELKTPLTSMIGYADLIRSNQLSEEKLITYANQIVVEGRRLEKMSMKLMDLIVLKKQDFLFYDMDITIFAEAVYETLLPVAGKYGVELTVNVQPAIVKLEPDLMKTVLINLFDNARKSMDGKGKISLFGVWVSDEYRIGIKDNGCGIDEENLSRLTEAFYMVDKSRSRANGGAGLGLAICNEIVKLHQAKLQIMSKMGIGTQVSVCFPKEVCRQVNSEKMEMEEEV